MCSLLIFAKPDNDHPDKSLDWKRFKRGDVIDVRDDDDFFWGTDIQGPKALGWWRVIVLPGVAASDVIGLALSGPKVDDFAFDSPYLLRANKVDLDALEVLAEADGAKVQVMADAGEIPVEKMTLTKTSMLVTDTAAVLEVRTVKPALQVAVIGEESPFEVIG